MQADSVSVMLPDWTQAEPANLYAFPDTKSAARISNRLHRVESTVPFRRRGAIVSSSSSTRFVQASDISTSGSIDVTSVQSDSSVTAKRDYDSRSTTRERSVV